MKRQKLTIVPRAVLGAAFAGVVPVCVIGACGGRPAPGVAAPAFTATTRNPEYGVAEQAFTPDAQQQAMPGVAAPAFSTPSPQTPADASARPDARVVPLPKGVALGAFGSTGRPPLPPGVAARAFVPHTDDVPKDAGKKK